MRVAIMQPAYLPWLGYFDLMDQVDSFVLLDAVQFSYQSWQHRNRIPVDGELRWVTVPVQHSGRSGQTIREVELAPTAKFPKSHIGIITQAYRRAPGGLGLVTALEPLLEDGARRGRLVDVTVPALRWIARALGVDTPVVLASELAISGWRSELLVRILTDLGATTYVTPPGAVEYLTEDLNYFAEAAIEVVVHRYEHPVYDQGDPFVSHASAVDAVAWMCSNAGAAMRDGRRSPLPLLEP